MSDPPQQLYFGDNLEVLRRHIADESVDLVYLDPPFNSNADYNVLFAEHDGTEAASQIKAFDDTWTWDTRAAAAFREAVQSGHGRVPEAMQGFEAMLGDSDMLAYLSMMAPRLIELHRVLKPTGSIYLHCDPTASHYLKMLVDAVFGAENFQNEIIWQRTNAHNLKTKRFGRLHDTLIFAKKSDKAIWNPPYRAFSEAQLKRYTQDENGRLYTGQDLTMTSAADTRNFEWRGTRPPSNRGWGASREQLEAWWEQGLILTKKDGTPRLDGHKVYLDEKEGNPVGSVWHDIPRIGNTSAERLGYPTQKPEALLERVIKASSNEGDVVLDPFCGCGTAVAVAQKLGRRWIGIDITHLAIGLIKHRLFDSHHISDKQSPPAYEVVGEPTSTSGARALAQDDRFQFQAWALGLVKARVASSSNKGADKGVDGRLFFHDDPDHVARTKQVVLSVKSGKVSVRDVRDLVGVLDREQDRGAVLGVLITLEPPTKPMTSEAASAGFYASPWGTQHARIQILTIDGLLAGRDRIGMPATGDLRTFRKAPRQSRRDDAARGNLF